MIREEKRKADKAYKIATYRAARTARSRTIDFIREGYNIKKSDLTNEAKLSRLNNTVYLRIFHKGVALIKYGARQTRKGVTFRVKKGKRDFIRGAFITGVNKGKHIGVFKRRGKTRFPIEEKYGPSVEQLFSSDQAREILQKIYYDRFKIEMERAIKYGK